MWWEEAARRCLPGTRLELYGDCVGGSNVDRPACAHAKEEVVLFPAIDAIEVGALQPTIPISAPIAVMQHEHDDAGALLAELRTLTDGYQPPDWGCATVRALYHGLAELESGMHVHVHLENNILFPRALRLLDAAVNA